MESGMILSAELIFMITAPGDNNLTGFRFPQGQVVAFDQEFKRVAKRRRPLKGDLFTFDKSHGHKPLADVSCQVQLHDHAALTTFQAAERYLPIQPGTIF
jgi:hypothetical protein